MFMMCKKKCTDLSTYLIFRHCTYLIINSLNMIFLSLAFETAFQGNYVTGQGILKTLLAAKFLLKHFCNETKLCIFR